jgi:hypothetical protein
MGSKIIRFHCSFMINKVLEINYFSGREIKTLRIVHMFLQLGGDPEKSLV